jgi:glycosyltransferase involved in cell wall biosynthesis
VKVCFLVNDLQLSGGVGVVVEHARRLAHDHGFDTALVLVREQELPSWRYEALADVRVLPLEEARRERFDVAVATWWETTFTLFDVPAERHAYFVQSLEDRFYRHDQAERVGAALTLDLPVAFITEARWIQRTLQELRPGAPVHFVRNGIDKRAFASPDTLESRLDGPLRVLVEGHPGVWFKGVPDAVASVRAMREPHHLTIVTGWPEELGELADAADRVESQLTHREMAGVYAESDVVLKLSHVEGMYGPPLEGFHMGATTVTTEVTGHDEYVRHGWNGMVVDWDDVRGTARTLDLLARDRRYLHFLKHNALATARGWPTWEQAAQFMALALLRIRREAPPTADDSAAALMGDLRGGIEAYREHLVERNDFARQVERVERIKRIGPVGTARRAWRSPVVQRTVGPHVIRAAKRVLGR